MNLNAGKLPLHMECIVKLKNTLSQAMASWGNKEALSLNQANSYRIRTLLAAIEDHHIQGLFALLS